MAQTIVNNALQEWNNEVKQALAQLHPDEGGAVYIMSLTRRKQGIVGGVMSKVNSEVAAQLVAGETHREATPEEIDIWQREQDIRRDKQLNEAAKREAKFNLDLGPIAEMLLKLGAAQTAAVAPAVAVPAPVTPPVIPPAKTASARQPGHSKTETAEDAARF